MSGTRHETNPMKKRRVWWLHSSFFLFIGGYVVCSAFFLSIIRIRELAFQLTGIFWLIMLPIIIWLYKRTIFEDYSVDQSIVRKTQKNILTDRAKVRGELHLREKDLLRQGTRTAVLDTWRLNPGLAKQHSFFASLEVIAIDPVVRELDIRIQILPSLLEDPKKAQALNESVFEFSRIISHDTDLAAFREFFDTVVLVLYATQPDDLSGLASYPVLSIEMKAGVFWNVAGAAQKAADVFHFASLRFKGGEEIIPHRSIELPGATTK